MSAINDPHVPGFRVPARDVQLVSTGFLTDVRHFSYGPLRRQQDVLIHWFLFYRYLDINFRGNNKKYVANFGEDHLVACKRSF